MTPWLFQNRENFALALAQPRRAWAIGAALRKHRKAHPECVVTGVAHRDCQVHHVFPVAHFPALALDPANFRTVRKHLHRALGHPRGFSSYNAAFDECVSTIRQGVRP